MLEANDNNKREFGVVLYEKSNAKHSLDAPSGKVGAKGWALRIYMILLGVLMFSWFIYSFINMATDPEEGLVNSIFSHLASLFVLLVGELILILTAFNAWGKFIRFALRHNLTRKHGMEGVQTRKLEAELEEVDANKPKEHAIRVYSDCVVVVNAGEMTVINRSELQRVKCEPNPRPDSRGYQVTFERYDAEPVIASMLLAIADLPLFRKHFDNFEYTPASHGKDYLKKKLPTVAFLMIPVLIGVGILILRSLVLPDMPFIFGAFFIAVGSLMIISQFSDIAVIGNGIMGILLGLIFTALPFAIALTIVDLAQEVTIAYLLSYFSPIHAGLSIFFGFGPMLIIVGIAGLVDCIRL